MPQLWDYLEYFKKKKQAIIQTLHQMVLLESPTHDKAAVDLLSKFISYQLKQAGCKMACYPQKDIGDIVSGRLISGSSSRSGKSILLLGHLDTIWPVGRIKTMPFRLDEDRIYGPGVLDMKGGLTMVLSAVQALHYMNMRPASVIEFFFSSAEETGNRIYFELMRKAASRAGAVICLEPPIPGGLLKLQRKGRLVIRLDVTGLKAHASSPEKGINAVDNLIRLLSFLKRIKTSGTSLNIGIIKGGDRANIVPSSAAAELDIRYTTQKSRERTMAVLHELHGRSEKASVHWEIVSETPPLEKSRATSLFFNKIKKAANSLGITLQAGKTGGASEASLLGDLGVPIIDGFGPDGDGIHADSEHLIIPSLVERTSLLTKILREFQF